MVKRTVILFCLLSIILPAFSNGDTTSPARLNKKRLLFVTAANGVFYTGSFIALHKAWYADYPRSKFHFFNDNTEWNQMDKAGHVWTTYQVSRLSAEMWKWTGLNRNNSVILGGVSGMVYQSIIEMQDAYSAQWGFSWGDVGSNVLGAGAYVFQELGWKKQKLQVKMSYWPKKYHGDLLARRNALFGSSEIERILKDYNSQTYWISANISSFFPESGIPEWLNISFGYGADGMYGARVNRWVDKEGSSFNYTSIERSRKVYLSPDVDLTRIHTRSKFLRSMFFILNMVKIPAPSLIWKSSGGIKVGIR